MNITTLLILLIAFVIWLLHFLPICDAIQKRFKLNTVISSACAAVISIVPFVNILAAISGAIYGWKMKAWKAITLFIILWFIVLGAAVVTKSNENNTTPINNQLRNAPTTRQINNNQSISLLHKQLTDLANEANKELPATIGAVRTNSIQAINSELHHNYTLTAYNSIEANSLFQKEKNSVIDRMQHSVCSGQDTKDLLNQGASLMYNYFGNDDKAAYSIKITLADCKKL